MHKAGVSIPFWWPTASDHALLLPLVCTCAPDFPESLKKGMWVVYSRGCPEGNGTAHLAACAGQGYQGKGLQVVQVATMVSCGGRAFKQEKHAWGNMKMKGWKGGQGGLVLGRHGPMGSVCCGAWLWAPHLLSGPKNRNPKAQWWSSLIKLWGNKIQTLLKYKMRFSGYSVRSFIQKANKLDLRSFQNSATQNGQCLRPYRTNITEDRAGFS